MLVSLVIPVLNELPLLEGALESLHAALGQAPGPWEVVISDAGSRDGSVDRLRQMVAQKLWRLVEENFPAPSVGKTVASGVAAARGEVIVVLPIDTRLSEAALGELRRSLESGVSCGGFPKRYVPSTALLACYAKAQNFFRSRLRRHLVWTNAIFARRAILQVSTGGFLEDVELSDRLRDQQGWRLMSQPVEVSARRYYPDRSVGRICLNGLILVLHRLRLARPQTLKRIYTSLR